MLRSNTAPLGWFGSSRSAAYCIMLAHECPPPCHQFAGIQRRYGMDHEMAPFRIMCIIVIVPLPTAPTAANNDAIKKGRRRSAEKRSACFEATPRRWASSAHLALRPTASCLLMNAHHHVTSLPEYNDGTVWTMRWLLFVRPDHSSQ